MTCVLVLLFALYFFWIGSHPYSFLSTWFFFYFYSLKPKNLELLLTKLISLTGKWVNTSVVWFFEFLSISESDTCRSQSLGLFSQSNTGWFWLFQKPWRVDRFLETIKRPTKNSWFSGQFLDFAMFWRTTVIYQNRFFDYFDNLEGK